MPNAKITGNIIGRGLKKARTDKKMSQVDLSAALSVEHNIEISQNLISKIESGLRPVRDKELKAIAEILGVTTDALFSLKG